MKKRVGVPPTLFFIPLILRGLSPLFFALRERSRKIRGDDSDPPPKRGRHAVASSWHVYHASYPVLMGSLSSVLIPAGRLGSRTNRSAGMAPFPSRQMISDRSSPSRDRVCLASLPELCCGPIQRDGGLQGKVEIRIQMGVEGGQAPSPAPAGDHA